jgi:predicted deacylase
MLHVSAENFDPGRLERGRKHRMFLDVATDLSVPLLAACGAEPGPVLVVSANIHGDEYEGVRAIFEVFDALAPGAMRGDLLAVPVANPPAFWSGTRTSPLDGANLARVFPGHLEGSPSQRLAWHLGQAIIARASLYLDLHSGGVQFRMPSMVGYPAGVAKAEAAAEAFGAPVVWAHETVAAGRTVSFAHDRGIPWLYTEARGAGRIHPEDLEMMKRGIGNLLRHLGITAGEPEARPVRMRLWGDGNTDCGLRAGGSGFFISEAGVLDRVGAGQRLGRLVTIAGELIEEYRAPEDGVVGLLREFPVVRTGDVLFLLAREAA